MQRARFLLVIAATFLPVAAIAGGFEFFLTPHDGTQLSGGEICIFPAATARGSSFLHEYFRSNDVRCLPAEEVLQFPAGRFNYFGVHPSGFVGRVGRVSTPGTPGDTYRAVNVAVGSAAYLDLRAVSEEFTPRRYVGIIGYDGRGTYFMPQKPGERVMAVPADVSLIPLFVDAGLPIAAVVSSACVPGNIMNFRH